MAYDVELARSCWNPGLLSWPDNLKQQQQQQQPQQQPQQQQQHQQQQQQQQLHQHQHDGISPTTFFNFLDSARLASVWIASDFVTSTSGLVLDSCEKGTIKITAVSTRPFGGKSKDFCTFFWGFLLFAKQLWSESNWCGSSWSSKIIML